MGPRRQCTPPASTLNPQPSTFALTFTLTLTLTQGTISKREFRGALVTFGLSVARKEVDALFEELDTDRGGLLDYRELAKVSPSPSPSP